MGIFGAIMIYTRKDNKQKVNDEQGYAGLVFGVMVLLYGQWLWGISFRKTKPQLPPVFVARSVLSVFALVYAMFMMNRRMGTSVALVLYCILGMPFIAVIHQQARKGYDNDARMGVGGMSDAERAALGTHGPGTRP